MNTPEQWLRTQTERGRCLYLMLDSDGQLDERKALLGGLDIDQYRSLYLGTPADALTALGPYIIQIEAVEHPALQALLDTPARHWGWLASAESPDLEALTQHWRDRLVTGVRPNQALYRLHDNRVLARALAYLQPEQRPGYLGPLASVCYWQGEGWSVTDNPDPGPHPLPHDPAWLNTPTPAAIHARVQFDNTRRYLMAEHTADIASLAAQQNVETWLRAQLELARAWGWREPEHIHFLLTQSLKAPGYVLPTAWRPKQGETPAVHFERLYREARYWQGDASV